MWGYQVTKLAETDARHGAEVEGRREMAQRLFGLLVLAVAHAAAWQPALQAAHQRAHCAASQAGSHAAACSVAWHEQGIVDPSHHRAGIAVESATCTRPSLAKVVGGARTGVEERPLVVAQCLDVALRRAHLLLEPRLVVCSGAHQSIYLAI